MTEKFAKIRSDEETSISHGNSESGSVVSASRMLEVSSGPLPSAHDLAEYSNTPGAVETILAMAQAQQAHRHAIENKKVDAATKHFLRQQSTAITILLCLLGGGMLLVWQGINLAGYGAMVASVVQALLSYAKGRNDEKKAEQLTNKQTSGDEVKQLPKPQKPRRKRR